MQILPHAVLKVKLRGRMCGSQQTRGPSSSGIPSAAKKRLSMHFACHAQQNTTQSLHSNLPSRFLGPPHLTALLAAQVPRSMCCTACTPKQVGLFFVWGQLGSVLPWCALFWHNLIHQIIASEFQNLEMRLVQHFCTYSRHTFSGTGINTVIVNFLSWLLAALR